MIGLYPALIEAIIETKRYLPIIKEKLKIKKEKKLEKAKLSNNPNNCSCIVAKGYKI